MLTGQNETTVSQTPVLSGSRTIATNDSCEETTVSGRGQRRLARALRIEWLGQMAASLCWIASVLTYGITSAGDWLQLCAASAWLVANIASIASDEEH